MSHSADTAYGPSDVRALDYCTWCPRLCHFACPAALGDASDGSSAWGMMTLANLVRRGDRAMEEALAAPWYRCTSCGRCTEFCRHGNDVAGVLQKARSQAVEADAHPVAIRELDQSLGLHGGPERLPDAVAGALAEGRAAASAAPAATSTAGGERVGLLLECGGIEGLGGEGVQRLLALLEGVAGRPVVPLQEAGRYCCGGVARRAGLLDQADALERGLARDLQGCGLVLSDCADALEGLPEGVRGEHLIVFLARHVGRVRGLVGGLEGRALLRHRGCAERRTPEVVRAEGALLEGLGCALRAAPAMNGKDECCGGEQVFRAASPAGSRRAAAEVARMLDDEREGAETVVTSAGRCACAMGGGEGAVRSLLQVVLDGWSAS